jgi:large conductance mechanosensitive channel
MLQEFKKFALRGNVLDLAVAVILGAAFGAIVKSFVDDIIMPPIGLLLGGIDFSSLFATLKQGKTPGPYLSVAQAKEAGAVTMNYGVFINTIITFIIVSFALFLVIRAVSKLQPKEAPAPATKECPHCFSAIPIKATRCPHCTSEL